MPKYSLKRLLIVVTLIAMVIGGLRAAYLSITHIETAENVAHVEWLPESASRISYYRSYSFTAFECDIPETDFKRWASWELVEIKSSEPVKVIRYKFYGHNKLPGLRIVVIFDGLHYGYRQSNGGGVKVAYDRSKGRAYYQSQ